jgi:hypothetical protein
MPTAADVAHFLSTHPGIAAVNFEYDGFRVYPTAYSTDMAGLITLGRIKVVNTPLPAAVGARYEMQLDELKVRPTLDLTDPGDQALVVHEMTHAHTDYHMNGNSYFAAWCSVEYGEALGYLAEALFRDGLGLGPLDGTTLRAEAMRVAKAVRAGAYVVPAADRTALEAEVAASPHYIAKKSGLSRFEIFDGIR